MTGVDIAKVIQRETQSMTDEEYRQQVQQRWRESMALLGIDDAGPAEPQNAEPVKSSPSPSTKPMSSAPLPMQERRSQ